VNSPTAKRADPAADVSAWEREVASQPRRVFPQVSTVAGATSGDERVYRLYGLTKEEVKMWRRRRKEHPFAKREEIWPLG
jgi:hypothetical protein